MNRELNRLCDIAEGLGYWLRDLRMGTLDGSGYSLRPRVADTGIRVAYFDSLEEAAAAIEKLEPLKKPMAPAALTSESVIIAIKKDQADPEVLRDVAGGIHPVVDYAGYVARKPRP